MPAAALYGTIEAGVVQLRVESACGGSSRRGVERLQGQLAWPYRDWRAAGAVHEWGCAAGRSSLRNVATIKSCVRPRRVAMNSSRSIVAAPRPMHVFEDHRDRARPREIGGMPRARHRRAECAPRDRP